MTGLLVHEWIERHGGSENVFAAMSESFPTADIQCLWNDAPQRFPGRRVHESWIARTPLRKHKALALPVMPATWAHMSIAEYDFVLISSHLFAHHIGRSVHPNKYVYVHTPARYLWAPELDARGANPFARAVAPLFRSIDRNRATLPTEFAANSEFVRDRIRDSWDRDATVIYPPVDVERLQSVQNWRECLDPGGEHIIDSLPEAFLLGASRFVSYKRLDAVIKAGEAAGMPVVLAGSGPQRAELFARAVEATVPVHIVDRPSDSLLYALYQAAAVFVFPAVEDFGIMPVEAMSLGTPAVVLSNGGAPESVRALKGGVVADSLSAAALKRSVDLAQDIEMQTAMQRSAEAFGKHAFRRRLMEWVSPNDRATTGSERSQ